MEKKLKGWLRARKIALIEEVNPSWEDLSEGWYSEEQLRIDEGEADPSLRR